MSAYLLALAAASVLPQTPPFTQTDPVRLDEVVVTGSLIPVPGRLFAVDSFGPADLAAAGVLDPSRLTALSPVNSGSEAQVDQLNDPQSSGTAQFNLRNLGFGSTLVLANGQRATQSAVVSSDGSSFVDVNALAPLIALERIDILKDGASATYGSDAVAGVVNFITRRRVDGSTIQVRHGMADGSAETLVEGLTGGRLFGGDLVLAASQFHRSALGSDEREFTQAERYGRAPWTAVTSYGQPGSYFRPSLNGFVPDPDCDDPAFAKAYRNSPSDAFCRLDYSDFFDLAPKEDRSQTWASWRGEVAGLKANIEAGWTGSETQVRQSPSLPILAGSPIVPAGHPDNPFGEDVLFRGRLLGAEAGASSATFAYDTRRIAAGLGGSVAAGWTWRANVMWSRQTVAYDKPDVIGSRLTLALNGQGGPACAGGPPGAGVCQWFNPFGSAHLGTGTANSPGLIAWLTGSTGLRGAASLWTAETGATGPVWTSGDAAATLAVGAQIGESRLRHDWSDLANQGELLTAGVNEDFEGRERTTAVFAESRLTWSDRFEAQIALRGERYENGPARLDPRVAALWSPSDSLSLRAGYSEGFKAPSVYARHGVQASQPSVFDRGAFVFVNTVTRGVSDLQPERTRSWTGAVLWSPLPSLELSLEPWRHEISDLVVKELAQTLIDRAAADASNGLQTSDALARVVRDPSGALSFVDLRFLNAASVLAQGVDLRAVWSGETAAGLARIDLTASHVDRYDVRLSPSARIVSAVGRTNLATIARSLPQDRANLSLSLTQSKRAFSARVSWTAGYANDRAGITSSKIRDHLTLDLGWTEVISPDWSASLGVVNATDEDPPLVQYALGYDPIVHDPRGRIVTLGLQRRF